MKTVLITGNGKLAKSLAPVLQLYGFNVQVLPKNVMNIIDRETVLSTLSSVSGSEKYLIHTAAMCKPMSSVDAFPVAATKTNIVGTFNLAEACYINNIKIVYISTDFVYPTSYFAKKETDGVLPRNKYAWSKLGGECVIQTMLTNFLILRCAITELPFRHKTAFTKYKKNSLSHDMVSAIIPLLLDETGVINLGGKYQSVYDFVSSHQYVVPEKSTGNGNVKMDIKKLKKILKDHDIEYITGNL